MCCYLRVWTPPPRSSHPGRGSWERGPEADLEWGGHKQQRILHPNWSYDRDKHSFVVHNNKLDWVYCLEQLTVFTTEIICKREIAVTRL